MSVSRRVCLTISLGLLLAAGAPSFAVAQDIDWPAYNGGVNGDHYSGLTQISRKNVHRLQQAWRFDTGETGQIQTNPLIVERTLYAYTPTQKVIALDAATGKLKWEFDSGVPGTQPARGLATWTDGHQRRIFAGVMNFLYCLDAETGKAIPSFGESGRVDLRKNLGRDYETQSIALTSPGIVYKDLIVVGGRNPETHPAPPGYIRAYDVRNGQLRWVFHTIPLPGEPGDETWPKDAWRTAGAANNWAGMSLDAERGILYAPTGSAVMDFFGGDRVGNDLYADCLLALDAATGKLLWYFQGVHHDIWDRDFPSPPALFTVEREGERIDAVAQTSKQGWLFLFNRLTGEPLFPVRERPYPPSTVPGEVTAPTQPAPDWPQAYARQQMTESTLTTRTPQAHEWALKTFRESRSQGQFLPLAIDKQTLVFPGFDGGAEWGGPAVDPARNVLYVNANEMAWTGGLTLPKQDGTLGEQVYRQQCAICHGVDGAGSPPAFPSIVNIQSKLTPAEISRTIRQGAGRMPSFPNIDDAHLASLLDYLRTGGAAAEKKELSATPRPVGNAESATDGAGEPVYTKRCAICHGDHGEGIAPSFPMLIGLGSRLSADQVAELVHRGKGRMPPMPELQGAELASLLNFLGVHAAQPSLTVAPDKYEFTGYRKFLDPDGYPAVAPPWGTLSAIDLKTGRYRWRIPLGEYPELGIRGTGSENYGGPIVTAGGVLFIGATVYDRKFHALDARSGKLLWETTLPFAAMATPSTYMVDGRQYVVTVSSGGRDPKAPVGGAYIAFAIPR